MSAGKRERWILAAGVGAAFFTMAEAASADWISLWSSQPSKPGETSGGEILLLFLAGTGATVGPIYAGVEAIQPKVDADSRTYYITFTAVGGALGLAGAIYMPFTEGNGPTFGYTFTTGLFMSMAGAGIGGLPQPKYIHAAWSGAWAGASTGLATTAVYRAVLSFAGAADFQGGAGAQALLGAMGAAGCGVDAAYSRGTERWFTLGCGIVSLAATVHGLIVLGRPNPPLRSQRGTTAFQVRPVPWMDRGAAGMALAGTF